jgi:hypothetical protein
MERWVDKLGDGWITWRWLATLRNGWLIGEMGG